jgi:hypothetical protein
MNIAAVVKDLSISQNSFYMIKEFNKLITNTDISVGAFFQRSAIPPVDALFGCKMASFINGYQGVLIATSLELAEMCIKSASKTSKYLYIWDMDWLENPVYFDTAMKIMRHKDMKILARSRSHADCIDNFCNRKPIGIVDNWNVEKILEIVK